MVSSSRPSWPYHDERSLGTVGRQHAHHALGHGRVGHPGDLASDPGRVGERAEEVEDGGDTQLAPGRAGMAHGRVEAGGEAEAESHRVDAVGHTFRSQVEGHAEGFEEVGGAAGRRGGPVAVLADPPARTDDREGRQRGDVDRVAAVAAGAHEVDHAVGLGQHHRGGPVEHRRHQARQLLGGLALHAQGHDEPGDLRGGGVAVEDLGHGRRRLVPAEVLAGGEDAQDSRPAAGVGEGGGHGRGPVVMAAQLGRPLQAGRSQNRAVTPPGAELAEIVKNLTLPPPGARRRMAPWQ